MAAKTTPLLGQFLVAINGFVQARNEQGLAEWIALEPPFNQHYLQMIEELKLACPTYTSRASSTPRARASARLVTMNAAPWLTAALATISLV